jgi:FMN reductase
MTSSSSVQRPVRLVALGGSTRPHSNTERALRYAAQLAQNRGAEVRVIAGRDLIVPIYDTETTEREPQAKEILEDLRWADGLLLASPGYHGGVSGLVKNVLDYVEDTRLDERPYLHDVPVGIIAVAHGWQAGVTTMEQMRTIVHALRGWPTPLGAVLNPSGGLFDQDGRLVDGASAEQLAIVVEQVLQAAQANLGRPSR